MIKPLLRVEGPPWSARPSELEERRDRNEVQRLSGSGGPEAWGAGRGNSMCGGSEDRKQDVPGERPVAS